MTDAEFQTLIDEANARITAFANQSFAKVHDDIRVSFQEGQERVSERFTALARELGCTPPESPVTPATKILYDDGEFSIGYTPYA